MPDIKVLDKEFTPYITEDQIQNRILEIATELNKKYEDQFPLFLGVLNGSFIFASDLFKQINVPAEISFIKLASYQGTETTGKIRQLIGLDDDITDRNVIIIEDIVDTGNTLKFLTQSLHNYQPKSLAVVSLLDKKEARTQDIHPDYVGFEIDNKFVVGYGLDYDGYGRNTRNIYQLK